MNTPNLALEPLAAAQAQKHVTVNEALARIDAAAQLSVIDRDRADPPATPADGDRYLVAPDATGAWMGRDGTIAAFETATGGWQHLTPREGWRVWVEDDGVLLVRHGAGWLAIASADDLTAFQNLDLLGVNATADATNRLAIASEAALFNHAGGNMRLTVNKAAPGDDASLTLQTGFSTRAQIGLTGDDALRFKVSPDGATFHEALTVNAATGDVTLEAARIAPGIGSFPNALPDGGRFCAWAADAPVVSTGYAAPAYVHPYNGSVLSDAGQFHHNNATHGGSGATLPPEVNALVQKIRGTGSKRHGAEWHVLKVAAGNGTSVPATVGTQTFHLAMTYTAAPLFPVMTMGAYVKVLTPGGTILPYITNVAAVRFDGTSRTVSNDALLIGDQDGWVWVEVEIATPAIGYFYLSNCFLATSGTEFLYALPKIVPGRARLDGLEILAHQLFYGSAGI